MGIIRKIKWFLQKVFRKDHTSDHELWSLDYYLAKIILPKLKRFKAMGRNGYPGNFISKKEEALNMGYTEGEIDKAINKGDLVIGGPEKWEESLDEMIFAFDFIVSADDTTQEEAFYKRYNLKNPYSKEDYRNCDYDLLKEYHKRADAGLTLFSRYFNSLWD